ncbi:MAG: response regulator [Gemmatimonadales bacterium]|nr:response regulator [Gemmatimonadales bacterium]
MRVGERARILVIDDDPAQRELLDRVLSASGFHAATAPDGEAGLASADAFRPHLVLCDILMPGLDGFATMAALRAREATACPVVLLSAKEAPAGGAPDGAPAADACLAKPVRIPQLLATIRALLPAA